MSFVPVVPSKTGIELSVAGRTPAIKDPPGDAHSPSSRANRYPVGVDDSGHSPTSKKRADVNSVPLNFIPYPSGNVVMSMSDPDHGNRLNGVEPSPIFTRPVGELVASLNSTKSENDGKTLLVDSQFVFVSMLPCNRYVQYPKLPL